MNARGIFLKMLFPLLALGGVMHTADAATLYIDPAAAEVHRGDTVTLGLRIDTDEGECINTVNAVVHYDASVRAVDVSRGDSILSIWVVDPTINEEAGTITFAGGIPGGYCGRIAGDPRLSNIVAELIVRAPGFSVGGGENAKSATVEFGEDSQVLLHDGLGTPARLTLLGAQLSLLDTPGTTINDDWNQRVQDDDVAPADFSITLAQDTLAFNNKHYIIFNSLDKQSGIDHYEVIEEPFEDYGLFSWGAADAPWIVATSPYVLKDQTLNSTIRVKAIDKAGNETIAVLVPDVALRTITTQRMILIAALSAIGLLIFGGLAYALWRRKRAVDDELEFIGHDKNSDE